MKACHAEVRLEPRLQAGGFDDHARLVRYGYVGGARSKDPHPCIDGLGHESRLEHPRRACVSEDVHSVELGLLVEHCPMFTGHSADQALTLARSRCDHQAGGVIGRFAGGEHDLRDTAPNQASEIEPRPAAKLLQLEQTQLGERLVLGELACDEAPEHVLHRPARTSRMRRQ